MENERERTNECEPDERIQRKGEREAKRIVSLFHCSFQFSRLSRLTKVATFFSVMPVFQITKKKEEEEENEPMNNEQAKGRQSRVCVEVCLFVV